MSLSLMLMLTKFFIIRTFRRAYFEFILDFQDDSKPKPAPRSKLSPGNNSEELNFPEIPDLPMVPSNNPSRTDLGGPKPNNGKKDDEPDIDFDDLSRRFEDLKKRK